MATTTFHPSFTTHHSATHPSLFQRFIGWCAGQQYDRLLWLGISLLVHGGILVPLVMVAAMTGGNQFTSVIIAVASMAMVVITNLAAMPTKITIPVLFVSILMDLGIIGFDLFSGLM